MVEIFLIWMLVNGEIYDTMAFTSLDGDEGCHATLNLMNRNKHEAMLARPNLQVDLVGCVPVQAPNPLLTPPPGQQRPT